MNSSGRARGEIWDALERRETYGASGPRILLWFDLLDQNAPGGASPMGSEVEIRGAPTFRVRAACSFEQNPGCPSTTTDVLTSERIESLRLGKCYFPSDSRRPIARIEVVRIRTQLGPDDAVAPLIEDPSKTLACTGNPAGCQVVFSDPEFPEAGRATSYYVRAIEAPSPVVNATRRDARATRRDVVSNSIRASTGPMTTTASHLPNNALGPHRSSSTTDRGLSPLDRDTRGSN